MPILALLPMLCICENPELEDAQRGGQRVAQRDVRSSAWVIEECTEGEQNNAGMVGRKLHVVWKDYSGYTDGCSTYQWYLTHALWLAFLCDFKFERTENNNFTITTHTGQHMEFYHFLIFFQNP